jgi:nucleotide-binding universal stress UspA family protein
MIRNILLPTDGSDTALNASELAIDMAKRYEATLHVLTNLDPISQVANPQVSRQIMDERSNDAEELMNNIASRAEEAGITARTHVTDLDSATDAIQSYCDEHDIDLVVMGTHGHSGLNRLFLGSTTERTLRSASIPVLAVPPSEEDPGEEE